MRGAWREQAKRSFLRDGCTDPLTPFHRHDTETSIGREEMKANTERQRLRLYAANKIRIQVSVRLGLGLEACRCGLPYLTFLIPALYDQTRIAICFAGLLFDYLL